MCCSVQGANRAAEDPERERRDREERLRHGRNPAARGMMPSSSGRPRGTQEVAPPTPLTPTSHTGKTSTAACWCLFLTRVKSDSMFMMQTSEALFCLYIRIILICKRHKGFLSLQCFGSRPICIHQLFFFCHVLTS